MSYRVRDMLSIFRLSLQECILPPWHQSQTQKGGLWHSPGSLTFDKVRLNTVVILYFFLKLQVLAKKCDGGGTQHMLWSCSLSEPSCGNAHLQVLKANTFIHWVIEPASASLFLEFFLTLHMLLVGTYSLNFKRFFKLSVINFYSFYLKTISLTDVCHVQMFEDNYKATWTGQIANTRNLISRC